MTSKRCLCFLFLIALWVLLIGIGPIQVSAGSEVWTTNGPGGAQVYGLAIDPQTPTTLYAATMNGNIYKSVDGGGSWNAANVGLTSWGTSWVVIDPHTPQTLYASGSGGVFKSTNGGESWSSVNNGLTIGIQTLAIDPQTSSTLYAGTHTVFKSINGGQTWSPLNIDLSSDLLTTLAIDPQNPANVYAGTMNGSVFKSTDGGGTWNVTNSGSPLNVFQHALVIDPQTPSTLYLAGNSGVFKSTDGGGSWSSINSGVTDFAVSFAIDPQTPSTVYRGGGGGVFKSANGGGTWGPLNTGLPSTGVSSFVFSLAIDPQNPTTLYAGTNGGGVYSIQFSPNTSTGSNVVVSPGHGTTSTFASVSAPGNTTATSSTTGPTPPSGFSIGDPPEYYNISTTATYGSGVTVCVKYNVSQYSDPSTVRLLHYENSAWVDVTTSNDTVNRVVCGQVNSLSPFLVAKKQYVFLGFSSPVDNLPTVNVAKAGQAIPIKWSLKDAKGNFVSNLATALSYGYATVPCASANIDVIDQYGDAANANLRYDTSANQFILISKTDSAWSGSCKVFTLVLSDGSKHQAMFQFKN